MTKRMLTLFLVCILAIPILVMPASATGWGSEEYNLLFEIHDLLGSLRTYTNEIRATVNNIYSYLYDEIYGELYYIRDAIKDFHEDWDVWEDEVIAAFTSLGTTITDSLTVNTSRIKQYFLDLRTDLGERFSSIGDWITAQTTALTAKFDSLQTSLFSKLDSLQNVVIAKIEAMQNVLSAKIDTMQSALSERLDGIKNALLGTPEDLEQSEQAGNRTDEQQEELWEMGQQIATQPTLNPDSIDDFVSQGEGFLGQTDFAYMNFISTLLYSPDFAPSFAMMIFISFLFAVTGYILYGKRY